MSNVRRSPEQAGGSSEPEAGGLHWHRPGDPEENRLGDEEEDASSEETVQSCHAPAPSRAGCGGDLDVRGALTLELSSLPGIWCVLGF